MAPPDTAQVNKTDSTQHRRQMKRLFGLPLVGFLNGRLPLIGRVNDDGLANGRRFLGRIIFLDRALDGSWPLWPLGDRSVRALAYWPA